MQQDNFLSSWTRSYSFDHIYLPPLPAGAICIGCDSSHYVLAFHVDLSVLIWYHRPSESYQLSLRTNTYNRYMNKQCLSNIAHANPKKRPQVYPGLTEKFPFFYFHLPYFLRALLLQLPTISKAAFLHNVAFSFLLSSTKIFQICIQVQISIRSLRPLDPCARRCLIKVWPI